MSSKNILNDQKLVEILLSGDYLTEDNLNHASKFAKSQHISLKKYLFSKGLVTKDILGQAIAEYFNISYADLNSVIPSREQVLKIPEEIAKKYHFVLFKESSSEIILASDKIFEEVPNSVAEIFPKKKVVITYSLWEDIKPIFARYHKTLNVKFNKIIKAEGKIASEIIDEIIKSSILLKTSDIHFEPYPKEAIIRFRIDGVLQEMGRIPKKYYGNVLNNIKILARLRIDEHYSMQDGAIRYIAGDEDEKFTDIRVSIAPTINGEKIVLRILSSYMKDLRFADLGLLSDDQKKVVDVLKKPFGMVLVSGPTGSGKTTTLYSLLKTLNNTESNIITIEDPVEYRLSGINQIQVNEAKKITFSGGLRSIVRQDPDIILVGEIRDEETAEIAVNAALTGHLMLSTFHANNAAASIPRLIKMGAEPFLLSSTLELIIAQRLARRICESCRVSAPITENELAILPVEMARYFSKNKTIYKSKGCVSCNGTGYKGRIALFELIRITPELQEVIVNNPSAKNIWRIAKKQGAKSLFEDGIEKVKDGLTTIEEVFRVAPAGE